LDARELEWVLVFGRKMRAMNHTLNGTDDVQPILICPRCKGEMQVHDVAPREPELHLVTFECLKCGHLETKAVNTR
jgi:hypothetical protein